MRILFVSSEVDPYSKTGGLADVLGALPRALAARGHECLVVSPRYGVVDPWQHGLERSGKWISVSFPFGRQDAEILLAPVKDGVRNAFLEHAGFYARHGLYGDKGGDFGDNHRRFAFLARGALEVCRALDFTPDVVHAHDWQTGLLPIYLNEQRGDRRFKKARSLITIHNLGYQGVFSKEVMFDLGLDWRYFHTAGLEFYDAVNFLKAGLSYSDAITTVSRRYAEEVQTAEGGFGLDSALRARRHRLFGILNGVDYTEWDPEHDANIPAAYSARKLAGKARCRQALIDTFGLKLGPNTMICGMVTRLAYQKGAELVLRASGGIVGRDCALVLLGNGDRGEEEGFANLARWYGDRVGVHLGFDRKLSHMVVAGADALLMPSRYEPCGLSQLYALRYGTVPIVRSVGGLDDTVVDATQPDGTGFKFGPFDAWSLEEAVQRARHTFGHPEEWKKLQKRGMGRDFSWGASSQQYEELYTRMQREGPSA